MPKSLLFETQLDLPLPEIQPRIFTREGLPQAIAVANYDTALASLLAQFKKTGDKSLVADLCSQLAAEVVARFDEGAWILVPIPSSAFATRTRGFVPAELISKQLARLIGSGARSVPGLWQKTLVADQAGLSVTGREANLNNSMLASPSLRRYAKYRIALVDDVVTTGATVREGVRALADLGLTVTAVFALGETLRKLVREV